MMHQQDQKDFDEQMIKRCLELAKESRAEGDFPFGAVVTKGREIVAEAKNCGLKDVSGHAEINALRKVAQNVTKGSLSEYTLYSNFEPCAMCSFAMRDVGIGRVVFSAYSPHLGGYSKWNILKNKDIRPEFTSRRSPNPPEVVGGILEKESKKIFDDLDWVIHKK